MNLPSLRSLSPLTFIAFALLAASAARGDAIAQGPGADPTCDPAHSVTIHTVMEFQDGLWAWRPVGNWDICVNDGGTSQITVNFTDETYQAIIEINGRRTDLAPPADDGWAFVFTRQDLMAGKPSAPARDFSFVLGPHRRERFELGGYFYSQSRNLRFSVSY